MAWQIGDKLKDGKYTIEQVLGHSGFGQTYVAVRNANNADKVVLKHLKKEEGEDDKTFRDRQTTFTNEAIRLASCEHPHIVKVRPETFWEEDLVHMVMEHIEGENLEVLVKKRQQPFSIDEALRYIAQIADALDHIHSFEPPLIHRDVKPANIVLRSKKTEAVLVDFGSAKEVRTGSSLSLKSIFTAGYSAIKIYSGIKKDAYTDVYSLGATLYFLLTKTIPKSCQERVIEDIALPIELNSSISQRVNDAIMAAMEIKPKHRVQTVTEFMQRLGQPLKPSIIHQGLGLFGAKVAPSNPQVEKQIVFEQRDHLDFRSAKERDYQELEELLEYQQWSMADELTAKLMLKDDNHCLDEESIKSLPHEDLRRIDQLWVYYSGCQFGFSVQKKIWLECGGKISKYNYDVWKKFISKVGWYNRCNNGSCELVIEGELEAGFPRRGIFQICNLNNSFKFCTALFSRRDLVEFNKIKRY